LKSVGCGKPYLSVSIGKLNSVIAEEDRFYADGLDQLTPREIQILKQIALSRTSKEIARTLDLSYRTVQNHRSNICSKLGLSGSNSLMKVIMTFPHLFNEI
jgi:DNA-binding CsgD family transcriptional regulator